MLEKLRSGEPLTAKEKQIHDQGLVTVLRQIHDELDEAVLEAYGWGDLSAKGTPCSGGLRPSIANEEAPPLSPNGIDAHRATLQDTSVASSNLSISASQDFSIYQDALLTRLVALNHERAAEEKRGLVRWLRPDYQRGGDHRSPSPPEAIQQNLAGTETSSQSPIPNPQSTLPWPDRLPEQVAIIRKLIGGYDKSVVTPDAEALSGLFGRKNKKRTEQIEGILETLKGLGQL